MAGAGWRDFVAGEVLTAANVQDYLQDQSVMSFATSAARGSAIAAPWQGATTFLQDTGLYETYYAAAGTANPGGRSVAGWYPSQIGEVIGLAKKESSPNVATTSGTYSDVGADVSYTPKNANSILRVTAEFTGLSYLAGGSNIGGYWAITDSSNNILREVSFGYYDSAGAERNLSGRYIIMAYIAAGSVANRTYKMRYKTFATRTQVGNDGSATVMTVEEIGQ